MPRTEYQFLHAANSLAAIEPANRIKHPNLILAICCMSVLIFSMDTTIVNVALPAIQKDLHARLAGLQWILDAYTLVVASFLMLAGSMSDRFGRRRMFQIGWNASYTVRRRSRVFHFRPNASPQGVKLCKVR
ncbi:MAG: MFS transporter [Terracidiphilus sp.]